MQIHKQEMLCGDDRLPRPYFSPEDLQLFQSCLRAYLQHGGPEGQLVLLALSGSAGPRARLADAWMGGGRRRAPRLCGLHAALCPPHRQPSCRQQADALRAGEGR